MTIDLHRGDNDKKYPQPFDDEFTTPTGKVKWNAPTSPNLQAHIVRVVRKVKHEMLNAFCVERERHSITSSRGANWYNRRHCHPARGNLPPVGERDDLSAVYLKKQKVVCDSEPGGHLKSHHAAA